MWWALLVACGSGASEAQRYRDALAAADWPAARAACAALRDDVALDCVIAAMDRLDVRSRDACDAMESGAWKDECLFRYAERVASAGDVAAGAEACRAMRYSRECSFHLVRNGAREVLEQPIAEAAPALEPWRRALDAAPDAPRLFWKTYFRERMARFPVDPTDCPDLDCKDGAREAIYMALAASARTRDDLCAASTDVRGLAVVGEASLRRWAATAETDRWVEEWRASECARRAGSEGGGARPPGGPPPGGPPPGGPPPGGPPPGGPPPGSRAPSGSAAGHAPGASIE